MKNTLIFIAFIALVLVFLFSISGERAHRIPEDANHAVFDRNDLCLGCHDKGMPNERGPKHPPKDDCIKCHKVKKNRKT